MKELAEVALNAARADGASYADIRISRHRNQSISTREDRVKQVADTESYGFGVRVLVDGTWGFAASHRVDKETIAAIARRAVEIAKANRRANTKPVRLAPTAQHVAVWKTPIKKDPFKVSIESKVELLLKVNAAALQVKGTKFCNSTMMFVNEKKYFASTEGSYIDQDLYRSWPSFTVTAIDSVHGEFESCAADILPRGLGYEFVEQSKLLELAPQTAENAIRKLTGKSVAPGKMDLVLHPSHLWLTIHESLGHPTELDRAVGYEANFAGTSFMTPDKLGKLQYGSRLVNFKGDRTIAGGLATCGYDDDGSKTSEWQMVRDGVFVDYQTIREQVLWDEYRNARAAAALPEINESHGCCYADSWSSIPIQRMPNVHLEPGAKKLTPEELIADVKHGIYIAGNGSWSIDQQRYNFQFGGQTFHEIVDGKLGAPLRDVAYQANTREFWNACDGICDARYWEMGGSYYCGKGEPMQLSAVSHGCAPARFRGITVLNTRKKV